MTNTIKAVTVGMMMAVSAVSVSALAQDDLDSLLKDLDSEAAKKPAAEGEVTAGEEVAASNDEAAASTAEEPKVEDVNAVLNLLDDLSAESKTAETKTEEKAVKPEEKVAEAEEKAAEPEVKAVEPEVKVAEAEEKVVEPEEKVAESEEKAAEPEVKAAEPEVKAAAPAPVNPDAELLSNIRATETLRRTALDAQAKREIVEARGCMSDKEYAEAVHHYGLALRLLNDREASKNLRNECNQGVAEGLYRLAIQEYDIGRYERAQKLMEKAITMRHPKARKVLEKWVSAGDKQSETADDSEIKHRLNDADYKLSREQIRVHLRRSRQYLALRDMKRALEECEVVLVNDPYNQDAIRIRQAIQKKRKVILQQERQAARDGMIADVDEAWRPVYAVNAAQLSATSTETVKTQTGEDPERTMEQDIERRMKEMRLPTISFKPPATIIDAVDFFRGASKDYDRPDIPIEKRGFNFVLKTPQGALKAQQSEDASDDFASNGGDDSGSGNGLPPIPTITASDITFYEALKLVCDSVDYKFIIRGPVVMVMHKDMSTAELLARKYDVLEAFLERMTSASSDVKEMKSAGFGGGSKKQDDGDENQEKDWKAFFEQMGVKWPEGSSIMYIKTLGKLYVRNTRENLAEFEKVLQEMGSQPKLIEIETRFVEVSQEDLNSLGFEWILNSDYSLNIGNRIGKALGIANSTFGSESGSKSWSELVNSTYDSRTEYGQHVIGSPKAVDTINTASSSTYNRNVPLRSNGGNLIRHGVDRIVGVNAFGGSSDQQNGNRYLSTVGNHISGESKSLNDQFMRVNAFLGHADLSMILHMLSQRSDTDLLSAPKVVTKSGENAVIKVVTEYIYPQDYDVQLQSSSSSGSSSSGGSQSAILAVVEPQNFTMREVGVILDVTPTYSEANGGTIDLELKPSVVDEPVWHNYGMKIPFSGNSSVQSFEGLADIPLRAVQAITALGGQISDDKVNEYQSAILDASMTAMRSSSGQGNMTWYDAPMEQPFFHVRSIDSKVSITPGSTVVMGGLITEQRKAMDDKIPFLGDLPYIGRLFRSHAEQTIKRNLLIFVTGRLITPSGRELSMNQENADTAEVTAAPTAE